MKLIINNISMSPDKLESSLKNIILQKYKLNSITDYKILKKSLDARKKNLIKYIFHIIIELPDDDALLLLEMKDVFLYKEKPLVKSKTFKSKKLPIVIGTGPAGLFAALRLIESGATVKVFERGKTVNERMEDINKLENDGILNTESNILFGEGGAGTYSDGKLTTRINRPEIEWFYDKLIEHGAPPNIRYESKPHLGTDILGKILKSIRAKIISSGSKIFFNEKLTDIIIKNNSVAGIVTSKNREYDTELLVLAIGHSARDTYKLLLNKNIPMETKNFAIGMRIEHPADVVNSIQYGNSRYKKILPTAEYRLVHNNKKSQKGIYSFCMCPGGHIINSSSEEGRLCTNGMSYSDRNSPFSNSAIVVTVNNTDFGKNIFSGIDFQRKIEEDIFIAGGENFSAPGQRVKSFLDGKLDLSLPANSYRKGVRPSRLDKILPQFIVSEIKNALPIFNRKMNGFISDDSLFIGAETRTSSPIRILRGEDYQSISIKGLYPIGEGSGYAGGIVSSAVDGIKVADVIIEQSE